MLNRATLTILTLAALTLAAANAAEPRIVITQANVSPQTGSVGQSMVLYTRVVNKGAQPIAAGKLRAEFTLTSSTGAEIPAGSASTTENLAAGSECRLQVTWSSAGAAPGTYSLRVRAVCLDGDAAETFNVLHGFPRLGAGGGSPPPPSTKQTGSLRVLIRDWDGSPEDAEVELTRGGVKIGEQQSGGGRAEWGSLEFGDYVVAVRRSRGGVEELWGYAPVRVAGAVEYTFTRRGLAATRVTVNEKAGGWPVTAQPGAAVKVAVTVKNPGASAITGKVRFTLDRDESGGYDQEYESPAASVAAGAERVYEWTATPREPGAYSLRVTVLGDSGGYTAMSHDPWRRAVDCVLQTAALTVAFTDEAGAAAECVGILTAETGAPLGERRGASVEWAAAPLGSHRLTVLHAPRDGLGLEEHWGTVDIDVAARTSVAFRRMNPVVAGVEVNGQTEESWPVSAAAATVRVTVMNPGSADASARVRLILDGDTRQPYDYDALSPPRAIPAGGRAVYEFSYTPREGAVSLAAVAYVDEGGSVPTDQYGWAEAVEAARGALRVIVRDADGAPAAEARVVRYDSAGVRLDEAAAREGAAEWRGVPEGDYTLEVYSGAEYWGSAKATVRGATEVEFTRRTERLTRLEAPAEAHAGDPVKLVLHAACVEASRLARVRVRAYAAGAEEPRWEASAERKLSAGADNAFEFTWTPQEAAAYTIRATVEGDYSGLRVTDTGEWVGAVTASSHAAPAGAKPPEGNGAGYAPTKASQAPSTGGDAPPASGPCEGSVGLALAAGSARPAAGASFTLEVAVKAARGVRCGAFTFGYDPARLRLDGVGAGDLFGSCVARVSEGGDPSGGRLRLVLARGDSAPAQASGSAARLTFTALGGGSVEVSLASAELGDELYGGLSGLKLSGYSAALGAASVDATGDGVFDYRDAAAVASSYGLSRGQQGYSSAADLNGDGRVGLTELALVASRGPASGVGEGRAQVSVEAPAGIHEGEEFTAVIRARWSGAPPAGCEVTARVDARGLRIIGAEEGDAFGSSPVVGALKLGADGSVFAAFAGAPSEGGGSLLRLRLASLGKEGSFAVAVEKASFCDAAGSPVAAEVGSAGLVKVAEEAARTMEGFSALEEAPLGVVSGVGAVGVLCAATLLVRRSPVELPEAAPPEPEAGMPASIELEERP